MNNRNNDLFRLILPVEHAIGACSNPIFSTNQNLVKDFQNLWDLAGWDQEKCRSVGKILTQFHSRFCFMRSVLTTNMDLSDLSADQIAQNLEPVVQNYLWIHPPSGKQNHQDDFYMPISEYRDHLAEKVKYTITNGQTDCLMDTVTDAICVSGLLCNSVNTFSQVRGHPLQNSHVGGNAAHNFDTRTNQTYPPEILYALDQYQWRHVAPNHIKTQDLITSHVQRVQMHNDYPLDRIDPLVQQTYRRRYLEAGLEHLLRPRQTAQIHKPYHPGTPSP